MDDTELSWRSTGAVVFGTPSSAVRLLGHGDLVLATKCRAEARLQEPV